MSGIVTDDAIWQFGYHANASVTTEVFEDGERVTATLTAAELKAADANIDPWEVLAALDDAAEAVQYQINGTLYTSAQIQTFIDDGDLDITSSGYIEFNNVQLDTDQVGYEVHTLLIEKLQDEINDLNDFIVDMQKLENVLLLNEDIEKKGEEKINLADPDGEFWDDLANELPSKSEWGLRTFVRNCNNTYIQWAEISASNASDNDTYYDFATAIFTASSNVAFQTNDITNAIEVLNNKVKERTTQVEQLGTDLQSNTSQYNSLMEAMSNYYGTYFDAMKSLLTGA